MLQSTSSLRARVEREAQAIAALSHPHICTLHDIGQQNGIDFLVMEHLEGETLAARLASHPAGHHSAPSGRVTSGAARASNGQAASSRFHWTTRFGFATELADALAAAHRAGVVHRDLKPGNLMLTKRGVVVLDFGLAKLTRRQGGDAHSQTRTDTAPLTNPGAMLGTLPYMALEQLEGREADARSDIFAFGDRLRDAGLVFARVGPGQPVEARDRHPRGRSEPPHTRHVPARIPVDFSRRSLDRSGVWNGRELADRPSAGGGRRARQTESRRTANVVARRPQARLRCG